MEQQQQTPPEDLEPTLGQDIRQIVGGFVGLALIVVPILLIRKLVKSLEGSDTFEKLSNALSNL